ncbi:hypothetical protein LY78DRAFT_59746 [Colletotrichum sublineola]|nr:hypothetical protein LY78DRAFT_59746 [Colletotrichum sublineola]
MLSVQSCARDRAGKEEGRKKKRQNQVSRGLPHLTHVTISALFLFLCRLVPYLKDTGYICRYNQEN